jgi:hypothetical protein
MYNPLNNHPKVREVLLGIQWIATGIQVVLGALFGFLYGVTPGDIAEQWPVWFLASLAVAPVLWSYLGFTAQQNVTGTDLKGLPVAPKKGSGLDV